MYNSILTEINQIDAGLKKLHSEGASLRALQQQHEDDINKRNARVEAEYASTLASLDESDRTIESDYHRQLTSGTNVEDQAEATYQSTVTQNSQGIRAKYDAITHQDKEYIADLENKCRMAAKNNATLLQKYGAIPGGCTVKPDLPALFELFDKIMTDTAETFVKRAMKKDGFYAQDAMIRDFIKGAAQAIAYLKYEINVLIPRDCNAEIKAAIQAADALRQGASTAVSASRATAAQKKSVLLNDNEQKRKAAALKRQREFADVARKRSEYEAIFNQKKLEGWRRVEAFLNSSLVAQFSNRVAVTLRDTGVTGNHWSGYAADRTVGQYFAWGFVRIPIHTSEPLANELKAKIPVYFDGKNFTVPYLIRTESVSKVYAQYDAATKADVYANIQTFILQKMRSNPANRVQVYFADPNDRGQNLGVLIADSKENEAIGIYTHNTKDGIREILKQIVASIDEMNSKLGYHPTLFVSNQKSDTKCKETVLVLCDVQDCIDMDTLPLLKVIWENAARCGISVLMTSHSQVDRLEQYYPNMKMDWAFLKSKDLCDLHYTQDKKEIMMQGCSLAYRGTSVKEEHRHFIQNFRNNYKKSLKLNNLFSALRDKLTVPVLSEDQRKYGKAYDGIRLPVMLDTQTNTVCRDFMIGTDSMQHMLVTGGTGSGKSRFLQMIISSIIMNYHPDDVELWLIDCKKVEFKKFITMRPQHVRLVSLERTREFTFAFFDYLKEFADRRTRLLVDSGVTNLKEYRRLMGSGCCMPRVVIMIDEFHAITANVNADPKYRDMLENALAEYRNIGISFIFSDQSISGLKGLTEKGRQQLHNRVAMKNSISEMKETLALLSDNYLPGTLMQMEKSEGIGDFWWNRNPNIRYKNVYIDNTEEEKLIAEVIRRGEVAKMDTKVVLIDGNERTYFDQNLVSNKMRSIVKEPYNEKNLRFYLGTPTSLEDVFCFELQQKLNHNVLITGRDTKMAVDVIVTMIKNVCLQGRTRIILLADSTDSGYVLLRRSRLLDGLEHIEIHDDYTDICQTIFQLHAAVKARRPLDEKVLVVWLGMPAMYDEFCISPVKPASLPTAAKAEKMDGHLEIEDVSPLLNDPVLMEQAAGMGLTVEELLGYLAEPEEPQSEETASDEFVYNAVQDMYDLFAKGAKLGVFNVVSMEYANDMHRVRGFNTDNFVHKIAFCMSRDESVEWGFRTAASELTEGLTAFYTSGIDQCVFRPFLQ